MQAICRQIRSKWATNISKVTKYYYESTFEEYFWCTWLLGTKYTPESVDYEDQRLSALTGKAVAKSTQVSGGNHLKCLWPIKKVSSTEDAIAPWNAKGALLQRCSSHSMQELKQTFVLISIKCLWTLQLHWRLWESQLQSKFLQLFRLKIWELQQLLLKHSLWSSLGSGKLQWLLTLANDFSQRSQRQVDGSLPSVQVFLAHLRIRLLFKKLLGHLAQTSHHSFRVSCWSSLSRWLWHRGQHCWHLQNFCAKGSQIEESGMKARVAAEHLFFFFSSSSSFLNCKGIWCQEALARKMLEQPLRVRASVTPVWALAASEGQCFLCLLLDVLNFSVQLAFYMLKVFSFTSEGCIGFFPLRNAASACW